MHFQELFSLSWGRVLANFEQLPAQLRDELAPYLPLVQQALAGGSCVVGLARQINAISVAHIHVRVVPLDSLDQLGEEGVPAAA